MRIDYGSARKHTLASLSEVLLLKRGIHALPRHLTRLALSSFGVKLSIEFPAAFGENDVYSCFPPIGSQNLVDSISREYSIGARGTSAIGWELSIDGELVAHYADGQHLLDDLESDMQMYVAEFATPHLFVHAGVVGWNGTAILLPGRSFAGKSTLVTSLVQAGATYYSDEYAVLDDQGRVWPYPRHVSLRNGPHGPARRLDLATDDAPCEPLPVSLIALLRYAPGGSWQLERRSPAEAIMRMVDQTVAVRRRPQDTLAYLGKAIEHATVIEGTRGEVDETIPHVLAAAQEASERPAIVARS